MDTQAERLMELRRLLANKDDARHISIPGDPSYAMFEDVVQGGKIARAEWFEKNANELESLLTEREKLLARVDELTEALRPFARFIDTAAGNSLPDHFPMTRGSDLASRQCTVGDFRRARSLLPDVTTLEKGDSASTPEGDRP